MRLHYGNKIFVLWVFTARVCNLEDKVMMLNSHQVSMEQFLHRVATPLNAARERPSTSATLRCWRAGQEAAKASRPASPTSRQPRTESLRSPWRDRPRAAKPESVTEHLPRSKERSLQQLPAKLARLEKKKIEIFENGVFGIYLMSVMRWQPRRLR